MTAPSEGVVAVYELAVAPLAFVLAWRHAQRALGAARACVELGALVAYGYALERAAQLAFASHDYGTAWRLAPGGVPLAVPLVWAALIVSALTLAARLRLTTPGACAAGAAVLALSLDLVMEPVAVAAGLWRWTPPGPWLGIPVGNFVGWAVIVAAYAYGAERFSALGSPARQAARRTLVATGSVLALLAVGAAWTALRLEARLPSAFGWVAWVVLVAAAAALGLRRRWSAVGTSLAGRLGAVPGAAPASVFLLLAGAFLVHAVLLGDTRLTIAAAGPTLALLLAAGGDLNHGALSALRDRMHGEMADVPGLVALLMKRRNGQAWTRSERIQMEQDLRGYLLPVRLLAVLFGSGRALLPFYAWFLDRRRGERRGPAARGPRASAPRPPQAPRRPPPRPRPPRAT
jgi:uncharacterized membrane protein